VEEEGGEEEKEREAEGAHLVSLPHSLTPPKRKQTNRGSRRRERRMPKEGE